MLDIQELNKAICMGSFQAVFSIVTLPLASVSPLCYCRFGVLSVSEHVESFTLPLYPPSPALWQPGHALVIRPLLGGELPEEVLGEVPL